jgi:hypothetical protein
VSVVADGRTDAPALRGSIVDALRVELPSDVHIQVVLVDRIEPGPRAKVRVVHPLPLSREPLPALTEAAGAPQ